MNAESFHESELGIPDHETREILQSEHTYSTLFSSSSMYLLILFNFSRCVNDYWLKKNPGSEKGDFYGREKIRIAYGCLPSGQS